MRAIIIPLALSITSDDRNLDRVLIDGAAGEGGGQILRSSLSLSAITGRPLLIERIRARRRRPGLRQQHLVAVQGAAAICGAAITGAELGSQTLRFEPGPLRPGDYQLDIGSAGSASLVLQTVLPPLLLAGGPSRLSLGGGTHNPMAPPFEFLERAFLPLLNRILPRVEARLERHGFYPAGGGRIVVDVVPGESDPLSLLEAGPVIRRRARALVAKIPDHVARRELSVVRRELGWAGDELQLEQVASDGPGNVLLLEVERASVSEVVASFGQRGVRAEVVGHRAVRALRCYLEGGQPVGPHLADQLLLPLCLGPGGAFCSGPLTEHARTNIEVIRRFLERPITVVEDGAGGGVRVEVGEGVTAKGG